MQPVIAIKKMLPLVVQLYEYQYNFITYLYAQYLKTPQGTVICKHVLLNIWGWITFKHLNIMFFVNITATFHGNGFEIDRWFGEV